MADFSILNGDRLLAHISLINERGTPRITDVHVIAPNYSNYFGYNDITDWVLHRQPNIDREGIYKLVQRLGVTDIADYFTLTNAVSLNDTLWIRPKSSRKSWQSVSPYCNCFDEAIGVFAYSCIGEPKAKPSPEFTTGGMLPKRWKRAYGHTYLYKGGTSGAANVGKEPFSEDYASQILNAMGIPSSKWVKYKSFMYEDKPICRCELFTTEFIGFRSQGDTLYYKDFDRLFKWQLSSKFAAEFRFMYVFDALILNTDRHLSNYGYLIDNRTGGVIGFAPLFDNGAGCMAYFHSNVCDGVPETDIKRYAQSVAMSCGASFDEIAAACLTPEIRGYLNRLVAFELELAEGDSESRLQSVNYALQMRLQTLLKL